MAMMLNGTNSAEIVYPSPVSGMQDYTFFCLVETSTPPNDTGGDQTLVGMHDSSVSTRMAALRLGDADSKFYARQRLRSGSQVATDLEVAASAGIYRIAMRWEQATGLLTVNVNSNTKVAADGGDNPTLDDALRFCVGNAFGSGVVQNAFFKGKIQYATQWIGTALSDVELAGIMDGTTRPKDSFTTPDYSYPLISDGSSDIAGTALTLVNTPTFDGVDLWDGAAAGPTITGPDTTTEGAVTVQAGTLQDTIVTQSLISGSYSIEQTIDSATAGTLTYNAESGVNQCTPSTPVSGVPLEPTIAAAGITPYVVQQEADDGTNPPATRNITLNPEATHEVIQTMAGVANTTPDQSIFGSTWVTVEDNHQARLPKVVDGVTFTWFSDGTFKTDIDKTVTFQYELFSPASGNWSAIDLTVKGTVIIDSGEKKRKNKRQSQVYQYYLNKNWKEKFQGSE